MRNIFFKQLSVLSLYRWSWLKTGFYLVYFCFIQMSNNGESSFARFLVNTLFCAVAISIIEIGQRSLQLFFQRKRYKKASLLLVGSYILFAVIGFYILHGSRNIVATEIWNQQFEASWFTFLSNFNVFYWTFFKYAVILFLFRQMLLLIKLLYRKEQVQTAFPEIKVELSIASYQFVTWADIQAENAFPSSLPSTNRSHPLALPGDLDKLSVKVGAVTHIVDLLDIVYLEVQDEVTTIFQIDGTQVGVKIPLSRFHERLPKDRFVRVHDSRVIALPYIVREQQGHVYLRGYEDKGVKLGKPERFPAYKAWKERNRLK